MTAATDVFTNLIQDKPEEDIFRVARRAYTDDRILAREKERIFDRCWIYLGHASELPNASDYLTRSVAGREIIFNRDRAGAFHAFMNTCPHRGAVLVREKRGNALSFQCFYHGWNFNVNGRFASRYPEGAYGKGHYDGGCADLVSVPRLDQYQGFYFVNFDRDAIDLADYLADAKEIFDLVSSHGDDGMEIVGDGHEYQIAANWKMLAENSVDGFHAPTTHSTYVQYLMAMGDVRTNAEFKMGRAVALGNGHALMEYDGPWGRPSALPVPSWGKELSDRVEARREALIARFGRERGVRLAESNRNAVIFPNLVINDIMSITVRTFFPRNAETLDVCGWALGVKGEADDLRSLRLHNFLEFLGPGGFATPDDVEALEACQRGYRNHAEAPWNDMSKGMPRRSNAHMDDEEQLRAFWREWNRRIADA
ncbi:MAG: Rieske 2Fe-2S domain-containing protein [Hyphomonadaceae bacterium]